MKLQSGVVAGLLGLWVAGTGVAQEPGVPVTARVSASTPPLPPLPTPVTELFRKLLVASPEELDVLLAGRAPESRAVLMSKLDEYRKLPPAQRELKLGVLDLRGYLTVLLPMDPAARTTWMATLSDQDRAGVEIRLRGWERLAPAVQQRLLSEGRAALLLSRVQIGAGQPGSTASALQTGTPLPPMPQLPQIERAVSNWRTLSKPRREKVTERMMEEPASPFEALSLEEREQCMDSFKKYMQLSKSERARFLYNAERWRKLSPHDRRVYRSLAHVATPPLPPARGTPPPPAVPPSRR